MAELQTHWKVVFFPTEGVRRSPKDFIDSIKENAVKAGFYSDLSAMTKLTNPTAQRKGLKLITHDHERFWQLRKGDYRLYFICSESKIVVIHGCRKKGRQMSKDDKEAAVSNIRKFYNENQGST